MKPTKTKMPSQIITILILLFCTVLVDHLSSFYDAHWEIAELSFDDPIYLGLSVLWAAVVIWLSIDIFKRKKHIPNTLKILCIIVIFFFILEFMEADLISASIISFQFLEIIMWLVAYVLSVSSIGKSWFVE